MNKLRLIGVFLLFATFSVPSIAFAQSQDDSKKKQDADVDVTTLKQLRGKVFELKYRSPSDIYRVVALLGSGYKAAALSYNDESRTIAMRDFPENIAAVEEAIKRLDTPSAARPQANLEVQVSILVASRSGTAPSTSDIPASIAAVLQELSNNLRYRSYRYVATFVGRTKENGNTNSSGLIDSLFANPQTKGKTSSYQYAFNNLTIANAGSPDETINVQTFTFHIDVPVVLNDTPGKEVIESRRLTIQTPLSMKNGETLVVGNANAGNSDESLFVVVSITKVK